MKAMQMQWQVDVRDADEAAAAVRAGAQRIEITAAMPEVIRAAVLRVRYLRDDIVIVAGVGQHGDGTSRAALCQRALLVADCGVDLVRVPVPVDPSSGLLLAELSRLMHGDARAPVMPAIVVPMAARIERPDDEGRLVRQITQVAAQRFPAVLLDLTAAGRDVWRGPVEPARLLGAIAQLRRVGSRVGVRAVLQPGDVPRLLRWAPDFACIDCGERGEREPWVLDPARVVQWHEDLQARRRGPVIEGAFE